MSLVLVSIPGTFAIVQTTNTGNTDNETEISIFNKEAYEEYKKNPIEKW